MHKFWNFVTQEADACELLLYGDIAAETWWGDEVTPVAFAKDLMQCGGKTLTVRINSGGGDVFAAQAIASLLKAYNGDVIVHIDGLCASAATVIACAASKTVMPKNALYMIHNPMVGLNGMYTAKELEKMQGTLAAVKDSIMSMYKDKVGADNFEKVAALMDEESWLTAEEAKALGLVDEVEGDTLMDTVMDGKTLTVNRVSCSVTNKEKVKALLKKEEQMDSNEVIKKIMNLLGIEQKEVPNTTSVNKEEDAIVIERNRMQALDALKTGNAVVDALVETAKATGKTVDDVKPFIDAIDTPIKTYTEQAHALKNITDLIRDNMESGGTGVGSVPAKEDVPSAKNEIDTIVKMANEMRGGK